MGEEQINDLDVCFEDLSKIDCGGAYRQVDVKIFVDKTLPLVRQKEAAIHETLGLFLGSLLEPDMIEEIAQQLMFVVDRIDAENNVH